MAVASRTGFNGLPYTPRLNPGNGMALPPRKEIDP